MKKKSTENPIEIRSFYPASLRPSPLEIADHKRRSKKWTRPQKEAFRKMRNFQKATVYLERHKPHKNPLLGAGGLVGLMTVGATAMAGPVTKAFLGGLSSVDGSMQLIPGALNGFLLLGAQAAATVAWMVSLKERQTVSRSELQVLQYQEWTRSVLCKDTDIQETALCYYKEACPFDPTQQQIDVVLGEHYENEGQKLGEEAKFYSIPFQGLVTGGTVCFGTTGCGKTTAVLKPIMRQLFGWKADIDYDPQGKGVEKVAGLVLDPKAALPPDVRETLLSAGVDPFWERSGRVPSQGPHARKASPMLQKFLASGKPFIGRENDLLELGYDEVRVERILATHDRVRQAARAMMEAPENPGQERRANEGMGNGIKLFGANGDFRLDALTKAVKVSRSSQQAGGGESAEVAMAYTEVARNLAAAVLRVVGRLFVAGDGRYGTGIDVKGVPSEIHSDGVPPGEAFKQMVGTPGSPRPMGPETAGVKRNELEEFAELRQMVRDMAPTKNRPGEPVAQYRHRLLLREARINRTGRILIQDMWHLATAINHAGTVLGHLKEWRPLIIALTRWLKVASTPLKEAIGEGSLLGDERETFQPQIHGEVRSLLESLAAFADADVATDIRHGAFRKFTVLKSTDPEPRPKSLEVQAKMGTSYAEPDPIVALVEGADRCRAIEELLAEGIARQIGELLGECKLLGAESVAWTESSARILNAVGLAGARPERFEAGKIIGEFLATVRSDLLLTWPQHVGEIVAGHAARLQFEHDGSQGDGGFGIGPGKGTPKVQAMPELFPSGDVVTWLRNRWREAKLDALISGLVASETRLVTAAIDEVFAMVGGIVVDAVGKWSMDASLQHLVARLHEEGSPVIQACQEAGRNREIQNLVLAMEEAHEHEREVVSAMFGVSPGFVNSKWIPRGDDKLLIDSLVMRVGGVGQCWIGRPHGHVLTPALVSAWDPAWAQVLWSGLVVALDAYDHKGIEARAQGFLALSQAVQGLAEYQCAGLLGFRNYVAPNTGHRCDGPFQFNPMHLPGLDVVNVAATFVRTVFATQNKGGKPDPFWENAGNALITNLLSATKILYGYTTFPILARLIGEPDELALVIKRLEDLLNGKGRRAATSEEVVSIQNIKNWYYGSWTAAGADKGETKVNIIQTISVVTQAFLAPGYQLSFAPQREADISFPGWGWIFQHGKIVTVALPEERHQGVSKIVMALVNRSFQKYVQLRDGQRASNKGLRAEHGRLKIDQLKAQREDLKQRVQERLIWKRALGPWVGASSDHQTTQVSPMYGFYSHADNSDNKRTGAQLLLGTCFRPDILDKGLVLFMGLAGCKSAEGGAGDGGTFSVIRQTFWAGHMLRLLAQNAKKAGWPAWTLREDGTPRGMAEKDLQAVCEAKQGGGWVRRQAEQFKAEVHGALDSARQIRERRYDIWSGLGVYGLEGLLTDPSMHEAAERMLAEVPLGIVLPVSTMFAQTAQDFLDTQASAVERELGFLGKEAYRDSLSLFAKISQLSDEIRSVNDALEEMPNTERYVVLIIDECHFFLEGESDAKYASVARSNKSINVIATQGPSSIYSMMEEKVADNLLTNFPNRIVMKLNNTKEAEECADLLGGKCRQQVTERNLTQSFQQMTAQDAQFGARGKSGGGSVQVTVKEEERYLVDPALLVFLPAFHAVASTWDGAVPKPPRRILCKPDFLITSPEVRNYSESHTNHRLPKVGKKWNGKDLYMLPAVRLWQMRVINPSR